MPVARVPPASCHARGRKLSRSREATTPLKQLTQGYAVAGRRLDVQTSSNRAAFSGDHSRLWRSSLGGRCLFGADGSGRCQEVATSADRCDRTASHCCRSDQRGNRPKGQFVASWREFAGSRPPAATAETLSGAKLYVSQGKVGQQTSVSGATHRSLLPKFRTRFEP